MRCPTDHAPAALSRARPNDRPLAPGPRMALGLALAPLAALLLGLVEAPARACAMMPHREGALAESDHQQAIFTVEPGGGSSVEYRVSWEGDAAEFGWIVALPDSYTGLSDGEVGRFEALLDLTAPRVFIELDANGDDGGAEGCGCGGMSGAKSTDLAGGGDTANALGVSLIDQGFTGTYDYVVLQGNDVEGMGAWLSGAGYVLDADAEANLAALVGEGGWVFAALRLSPEAGSTGGALPPIRFALSDARLVFPARMGRISDGRLMKNTFFVLGPTPMALAGWGSVDAQSRDIDDQDPVEAFEEWQLEVGTTEAVALRTYVGEDVDGRWITRFDSEVEARAMIADARLEADAVDAIHTTLEGRQGRGPAPAGAALLPLGLLVALGLRRRRPGRPAAG